MMRHAPAFKGSTGLGRISCGISVSLPSGFLLFYGLEDIYVIIHMLLEILSVSRHILPVVSETGTAATEGIIQAAHRMILSSTALGMVAGSRRRFNRS